MKKSFLAIALLLIAAAIALGFLLKDDNGRGRGDGASAPGSSNSQQGTPADSTPLLPVEQGVEGDETQRSVLSNGLRIFGDWDPRFMDGQLRLPPGSPPDPTLRVLVLARHKAPVMLHGQRGLLAELAKSAAEEPEGLLASSMVSEDGSFQLPYPSDEKQIWLALDGRYLYMEEVLQLELPAASCELRPLLGGYVKSRILLPRGPHGPQSLSDEVTWNDLELRLSPDPSEASEQLAGSPWAFRRIGLALEAAGEFEFRALPVQFPMVLEARSHILADFEQTGITLLAGRETLIEGALSRGATVSGWVLDPSGAPVQGADVKFATEFTFGLASKLSATAITDEEGQFLLMGLGAASGSVSAEADGFKSSKALPLQVAAGEQLKEIELNLERGASISGQVRFNDGTPASAVKVSVANDPAAMGGLEAIGAGADNNGSAMSDDLGGFLIQGLGSGPFEVSAVLLSELPLSEGLWFARISGIKPGQADIELVMQRTSRLVGHVRDLKGDPVSAFTLRAERKDSSNAQAAFARQMLGDGRSAETTDLAGKDLRLMPIEHPEGEFVLEALTSGIWSLNASSEGFAESEPLELTLPIQANQDALLIMAPGATLSGIVLTPGGEPVSGARVTLQLGRNEVLASVLGQRTVPEALSDSEGHFLLQQLAAGPQLVTANHAEHGKSLPLEIDPIVGQALLDVTLVLTEGGTIFGQVFGSDGQPADDVRVIIQSQAEVIPVMRKTAGGGSFRAEHLSPGQYTVTALFDGGAGEGESAMASMLENMKFDIAEVREGTATEVILGQPPLNPVQVSGRVTHLGEPLSSALLSFLPEDGRGFSDMKVTTTKEDGSYSCQLGSHGDYMVTLQVLQGGPGQQQQVEHNRAIPKGETFNLDFELPGARISGRVEDAKGQPLSSTRVSLNIETGAQAGTLLGGHFAEVLTDSEGAYHFNYLREGSYSIAAGGAPFGGVFGTRSPNGREIQSPIRVGEDEQRSGVDFRLGAAGDITGTVIDAAGNPVSGASIFVRDERGRLLERFTLTNTAAGGGFEYLGVAPGNYTVSAHGTATASRADVGVRVRAGEKSKVTVPVNLGTMLVIKLADKTELPISGAKLSVKNEAGHEMSGMFNLASIMERFSAGFSSAEYRVGPLPPGTYTVEAESTDGRSIKMKVKVSDRGREERPLKVTIP